MRVRGPAADSYVSAVVLVLAALTPYLVLTTALTGVRELITGDLGMTQRSFGLTVGMANAAYSFGTVLSVQLSSRLHGRRLLLLYALLFVLATVAMAWAPTRGFFIAGHVIQGLATGLMLIAAVPPLILGWPARKIRPTAAIMNLGIFGAVALGPVVGGISAGTGTWRPMLWIVAGVGGLALLFAALTFTDQEPADPDAPIDVVSVTCAGGACGTMFFAVSELMSRRATDLLVLGPVCLGAVLLVILLVHQTHVDDPLIPVRKLAHTLPIAAIVVAMAAGAASVAAVQLTQATLQQRGVSPTHSGMLFWPQFGAALLAAVALSRVIVTRWLPVFAAIGLVLCAGGVAMLTTVPVHGSDAVVLVAVGLVGLGVGASVAPALFTAGFSLASGQLPRVLAFVELLRGVAAFLVGPALMQLATTVGGTPAVGSRTALWISFGIAGGGVIVASIVFALGAPRLHEPRIEDWLEGRGPALDSPPLLGAARDDGGDQERAPRADARQPVAGR